MISSSQGPWFNHTYKIPFVKEGNFYGLNVYDPLKIHMLKSMGSAQIEKALENSLD